MATDAGGLYQILEIPEPVARNKHLLGSVVPTDSYTTPLSRYAPYHDLPRWETKDGKKAKKDLDNNLNSLWKASSKKGIDNVPLHQLFSDKGSSNSDDASVKVTEVLKAFFNKNGERNFKIEGGETQQYNIDNPGSALEERLCKCEPWLNEVQRLYEKDNRKNKDRKYLIVTGVWACKNTVVSWEEDNSSKKGLESKVPVDKIVSGAAASQGVLVPPNVVEPLNSEVKKDQSRGQHGRARATLPEDTIFAVRYHLLKLNLEPTENTKEQKSSSGLNNLMSKLRFKRRNSGLTERPPPKIKSLSLDKPLRGGNHAIGSYGGGSDGLLYWVEPDFVSPEDVGAESNAVDAGNVPNGVAH